MQAGNLKNSLQNSKKLIVNQDFLLAAMNAPVCDQRSFFFFFYGPPACEAGWYRLGLQGGPLTMGATNVP
jgi:hypothetical protein